MKLDNIPPEKTMALIFAVIAVINMTVTIKILSMGAWGFGVPSLILTGFMVFLTVWTWRQE